MHGEGPQPSSNGRPAFALVGLAVVTMYAALLCSPRATQPSESGSAAAIGAHRSDPVAAMATARHAPTAESKPRIGAPLRAPGPTRTDRSLSHAVDELSALLHAELRASAARHELERCAGSSDESCLQILSDALREVIANRALPALVAGTIDVRSLQTLGADAIYRTLDGVLASSRDPVERVAALLAAQAMPELPVRHIGAAAYRGFDEKPPVEQQLLLERHADLALDDPDLARIAGQSAVSPTVDERVRDVALLALGHAQTSAELTAVVHTLASAHDGDWDGWQRGVAAAVGRCGEACLEAIELLAFGDPSRLGTTDEMMRAMTPEHRAEVRAYFGARMPASLATRLNRNLDSTLPDG